MAARALGSRPGWGTGFVFCELSSVGVLLALHSQQVWGFFVTHFDSAQASTHLPGTCARACEAGLSAEAAILCKKTE